MARSITVALELDSTNFNRNLRDAGNNVDNFEQNTTRATTSLTAAFKALAAAVTIKEVITLADEFTTLNNRLKAITESNAEAGQAFEMVRNIANSTRNDIGAVGDLFTNITVATDEMGLSMGEVAGITETFAQSLKISGADANASAGAIRQFGQALASGVLRGDEFNSIMEANPVFMRAMAEALDQPIGKLRELAADGQLTADVIVAATQEMAGQMDATFGETVPTIAESFQVLKNEAIAFLGALEERTGLFEKLSKAILFAAENLDILAGIMAGVFAAAAVGRIVAVVEAVIAFTKALRAAAVAGTILQGVTGVGLLKVGAGLAAATATIATMNGMFDEQDNLMGDINQKIDERTEKETAAGEAGKLSAAQMLEAQQAQIDKTDEQIKKAVEKNDLEEKLSTKKIERITRENDRMIEALIREQERREELEEQKKLHHEQEVARANGVLELAAAKAEADLKDIEATVEKIGLTDTQIKQLEVTNDLNRIREEKLAEIAQYNITDEEKNELQQKLNDLYDEQIAKQTEAIAVTDEQQRRFSTGWKNAWADYKDAAADNAKLAGDLFATVTRGMEDAFVDFVMTGKTSFKDLIDEMIKQLLRIVAKKIFIAIIDILTGGLGSVFEGFFDKGGRIGAGKFGVVGENGPEIVYGPATVVGRQETAEMLGSGGGGGGMVTYNINAVDARSFRQLVAQDPEFIYSVTQAGRRSLPR